MKITRIAIEYEDEKTIPTYDCGSQDTPKRMANQQLGWTSTNDDTRETITTTSTTDTAGDGDSDARGKETAFVVATTGNIYRSVATEKSPKHKPKPNKHTGEERNVMSWSHRGL